MSLSLDQSSQVREGEQLNLEQLEPYLQAHLEADGPLTIEQFPSGYSNLTYLLKIGDQQFVLRRPPFGNQVKSAHDMGREYRVLSRLWSVYELAPRPFLYCTDTDVIGSEFYVMERRTGAILRGKTPPAALAGPDSMSELCESFIENLARLHQLDYAEAGLGEIGKADGYVDRQIDGWIRRYEKAQIDDLPNLLALAGWLDKNRPTSQKTSLIHNDYKYDNLILDMERPQRIIALLDWEMTTIGDPWMDVGTSLGYWIQADDPPELQGHAFGPTMVDGSLTRRELVERYIELTDHEPENPLFYYCYGLFKLAVIVQQIYARYVRGHTQDKRFSQLNRIVASLGDAGQTAIARGEL